MHLLIFIVFQETIHFEKTPSYISSSFSSSKNILMKIFSILNNPFAYFETYLKEEHILINTITCFLILFQAAKHFVKIFRILNIFLFFLLFQETMHFELQDRIFSPLISTSKTFLRKYFIFLIMRSLISFLL